MTKGKLPTSMWIEVVTTAHEVGLRSSSTMMYGHVDTPRHWVGHLQRAARHPGPDRRVHRVRAAAVRAPVLAAVSGRRGPPRPDPPRQPRRPRAGADHVARQDLSHPDQLGQTGRRAHAGDAQRRRERPRRHVDGGDDLADGRLGVRLGQVRRGAGRRSPRASAAPLASAPPPTRLWPRSSRTTPPRRTRDHCEFRVGLSQWPHARIEPVIPGPTAWSSGCSRDGAADGRRAGSPPSGQPD